MRWVRLLAVAVLAGLFAWAGVRKLLDRDALAIAITGYRLLPGGVAAPLAAFLPWLELVAAIALVVPRLRRTGLVLIAALLVVFTAAAGQAWWRGIDLACGCFGDGGASAAGTVVRNAVLLALCVVVAATPRRPATGAAPAGAAAPA